jgi:hypothetical protein
MSGSEGSRHQRHGGDRERDGKRGEPGHERGRELLEVAPTKGRRSAPLANGAHEQDRHGKQAVADAEHAEGPMRPSRQARQEPADGERYRTDCDSTAPPGKPGSLGGQPRPPGSISQTGFGVGHRANDTRMQILRLTGTRARRGSGS